MSEKVTELDFDVVREPWNKYELFDGSILWTKHILLKIFKRESAEGRVGYELEGQHISSIHHVPDHLKGPRSETRYSEEELRSSIIEEDVKYNTLAEEWCEYVAEDGTRIRIKSTVTKVSRTNKTDRRGDPIYLIEQSILPIIKPPKR